MADRKVTLMTETHKDILRKSLPSLVKNLILCSVIWSVLISNDVITPDDKDRIEREQEKEADRVLALILLLQRKSDDAYYKFLEALEVTEQRYLVVDAYTEEPAGASIESGAIPRMSCTGLRTLRLVGPWQVEIAKYYRRRYRFMSIYPHGSYMKQIALDRLYVAPKCSMKRIEDEEWTDVQDIHSIFRNRGKSSLTFLKGSPGSGKTTLVNWCLATWANAVITEDQNESLKESGFMYDLIICIHLKHVKPNAKLEETIRDQIRCSCHERIMKFIESNRSQVLIICDGLDEYDPDTSREVTSFLQGDLLPGVPRLTTSRETQAGSRSRTLVKSYDTIVELHGFDDMRVIEYIGKYFVLSKQKEHSQLKLLPEEEFKKKIANLGSLSKTPLHLCFLCQLAEAGADLSKTKTDLHIKIVKYILDVNKAKAESPCSEHLNDLQEYHNDLTEVGTAALALIMRKYSRFTFTRHTHTFTDIIKKGCKLGLIIPTDPEHLGDQIIYAFLHVSLQEFLAAYAVVYIEEQRQLFLAHVDSLFRLHDCRNVITFVCGLSEGVGNLLLFRAVGISWENKDIPSADECPYFNHRAWHTGHVTDLARLNPSIDISNFIAQCFSEYKLKPYFSVPLSHTVTLDLSRSDTLEMLLRTYPRNERSVIYQLSLQNGCLDTDILDTLSNLIYPEEVVLFLIDVKDIGDIFPLSQIMENMTKLKKLNINVPSLKAPDCGRLLKAIQRNTTLVRLSLTHFNITGNIERFVSCLKSMPYLVKLIVKKTDLSLLGDQLASLLTSEHLSDIDISNINATKTQIGTLCGALPDRCPRLLMLNMSENDLCGTEDHIADAIFRLPRLLTLYIRECGLASESVLRLLGKPSNSLQVLDIFGNPISHLRWVPDNTRLLQSLRYIWCMNVSVSEQEMHHLVDACKQILPDLTLIYNPDSRLAAKTGCDNLAVETRRRLEEEEFPILEGCPDLQNIRFLHLK